MKPTPTGKDSYLKGRNPNCPQSCLWYHKSESRGYIHNGFHYFHRTPFPSPFTRSSPDLPLRGRRRVTNIESIKRRFSITTEVKMAIFKIGEMLAKTAQKLAECGITMSGGTAARRVPVAYSREALFSLDIFLSKLGFRT
jgi:hypothetical protein